jgi:hypothetical protein
MNAGIPGYTTVENLQLLQLRLLKYKPEAIVYMGFRNDNTEYAASLEDGADFNRYPRHLGSLPDTYVNQCLMQSSLLGFLLTQWGTKHPLDYQGVAPRTSGAITGRGEALFRDQIALVNLLCKRHGVKLLWVDQPVNPRVDNRSQEPYSAMRKILHDELNRQEIPLLRAHDLYDHAAAPMLDDVHFKDAGNEQLASIIAPQLLALLP